MDKREKPSEMSRRGFFKAAGLGVGAAVGAAAGKAGAAQTKTETARPAGYRETEHVKTYYELAKF